MSNEVFCKYHIKTVENPKGTDCAAHLDIGQCFECPYKTSEIRQETVFGEKPRLYISHTGDPLVSACQDFEPLPDLVNILIKKLRKD